MKARNQIVFHDPFTTITTRKTGVFNAVRNGVQNARAKIISGLRRVKRIAKSPQLSPRAIVHRGTFIALKVRRKIGSSLGFQSGRANSHDGLFVPLFQIFTRPGTYTETVFGWRGGKHPLAHHNLVSDSPLEFTFLPLNGGFLGLHLFVGTHSRVNTSTINIEVYSIEAGPRTLIASASRKAWELEDNKFNYFPFDRMVNDPGKEVLVRVWSPDASYFNCIALWGSLSAHDAFKRAHGHHLDCIDFHDHPNITTRFEEAPRREHFFPRFTASFQDDAISEHSIGWRGVCFKTNHVPIYPNSSAQVTFQATRDRLSKIVLTLVNFSRVNHGTVEFCLSRKSCGIWNPLCSERIEAQGVRDNAPFEFKFPAIDHSKGAWFKLDIFSNDSSPTCCIGVQGTSVSESLDVFKQLSCEGDLISMVDAQIRHPNPSDLYQSILPLWERLKQPAHEDRFKALVITDELPSPAVSRQFSSLSEYPVMSTETLVACEEEIADKNLIVLADVPYSPTIERVLEVANRCCIPVATFGYKPHTEKSPIHHRQSPRAFKSVPANKKQKAQGLNLPLLTDADLSAIDPFDDHRLYLAYRDLFPAYRVKRLPKVSVVSILYRKEAEIGAVLESLRAQDYPGEMEILLVDDCSPDRSAAIVQDKIREYPTDFGAQGRMPIHIIRNQRNTGNCGSRNKAITQTTGDVVLIIDADCVLNSRCISAHASCHGACDVEVVIGTHNLETNHRDPLLVVREFENAPVMAQKQAQLQDAIVPQSFLNSITRNVSIRRDFIEGELFDERFAYSADPQSGFGWEDVEMGCRLYKRGARFRYINQAISVHISHPSSCDEGSKPARSIKNFRRLLEKHPDLRFVSRRWVLDTFLKICAWMDNSGIGDNADRQWVADHLKGFQSLRGNFRARKSLRIASYRWHCPHQYEIYKLPHQFTLFKRGDQAYTNSWAFEQRPLHPNVVLKDVSSFDSRDYDLAILHFDENVLYPENTNGILGCDWGASFNWFRENANLPMVAICHGTPQFRGQYNSNYLKPDLGMVLDYERQQLVNCLSDIPVVCNSYQAQAEWRFKNSRVIWHGFDPMEFGPEPTREGILTLGEAMFERPVYRGAFLFNKVRQLLPENIEFYYLRVPRPPFNYESSSNDFAYAKFRLYNQEIRKHSIYFNPTERSPMPRSRGESMMSGLVSVSANNHDVSLFIKNGINGFYSNDPAELAEYLLFLSKNSNACREMGRKSRALASDIFNIDRFHRDWNALLDELGV